MDSRIRLSPGLLSLIVDFEQNRELGRPTYIDEKEYHQIISYYEEENELDSALDVIELAICQFSYRADFLSLKARIYIKKGLLNEALEILARAELMAPYEVEIQLLKANIYIHQKRYNDSIVLIEDLKLYANKSDLEDIFIAEAFFYESIQEFDAMFQSLKQVLILNPNNEEALSLMNISVDQSRNYEESILLHKLIVENEPYNYLAWYNLGNSYGSVGEYQLAIEAMEYSFIINPEFEMGYLDCAGYCDELKKHDRALDIYQEALSVFGPDFDLLMNISNCQFFLGKIDQAKRSLFSALELDSYNDEAYFLLAKCYIENEDWNSAIKVLRKAITIENNVEEYYHALGLAYHKIEKMDRAKYYYKKAAEKGFEQSKYWEDYLLFLMEQENYLEALEVSKKADRYTYSYSLQYLTACACIGFGDKKRGFALLEEALEESYDDHKIIFKLPSELSYNKDIQSILMYFKN